MEPNTLNTAAHAMISGHTFVIPVDEKEAKISSNSRVPVGDETHSEPMIVEQPGDSPNPEITYRLQIYWRNVAQFTYMYLAGLYGLYLSFTSAKIQTTIWGLLLFELSCLGITAGAHRLWCHRSYKATWQLKLILITLNSLGIQNSVYDWVRDHRVHHKFSETDADPHNAKRGFVFSHIGWLCCRKHPDVLKKGQSISLKDLDEDPFVQFQKRHYWKIALPLCFLLPTMVPVYFWGETWRNAWHVSTMLRYCAFMNATFLVNSAAHLWGNRPYDKSINPAENITVAFLSAGEGWHNYHHVFPWDYKAAELGNYRVNVTTGFLDFFAKIGWAYDLKTVPSSLVYKRASRTGAKVRKDDNEGEVWGWGDEDMPQEDMNHAVIWKKEKSV